MQDPEEDPAILEKFANALWAWITKNSKLMSSYTLDRFTQAQAIGKWLADLRVIMQQMAEGSTREAPQERPWFV